MNAINNTPSVNDTATSDHVYHNYVAIIHREEKKIAILDFAFGIAAFALGTFIVLVLTGNL